MAMARGFCSRPSEIPRRPQTASKWPVRGLLPIAAGGQEDRQEYHDTGQRRV